MCKGIWNRRSFFAWQRMRRFFPIVGKRMWFLGIIFLFQLCGCGKEADVLERKEISCNVVLEQGEGFLAEPEICQAVRGSDVSFLLSVEKGYQIVEADYGDYTLEYTKEPGTRKLTLHNVQYPVTVCLTMQKSEDMIAYYANGGNRLDGGNPEEPLEIGVLHSHRRVNTALGTDLFVREGYTLLGWNTKADGSGEFIGLGSRVAYQEGLHLYAVWCAWSEVRDFSYEAGENVAVITGYHGQESTVCVPAKIGDCSVIAVGEDAFAGAGCQTVILPDSIQRVESFAFRNSAVQELYLYDNLSYISDSSFADCGELRTLHINAIEAPVYSGTYYDTFQDKYDRLVSLGGKKKLILFSGSSTRFGYDSQMLAEEFPEYEVVNMGVFAYTNALPQFLLIEKWVSEGDILLHAPEFDARQRQFCTTNALDDKFFCMMESNYDAVAELDLRQFSQVFTALYTYLSVKEDMDPKSYDLSPLALDEDGNPVDSPSYNEYGDYIVFRENADSEEPVYGLMVEYTVESFPKESYFQCVNDVYQRFLDKGVRVYFTYAPRNRFAVSEDSTPEERERLHQYLQEQLVIPVISDLEESLYSGIYLNGTDNHLSTQGVEIRTKRIIRDLQRQMAEEAGEG